MLAFVPNLSSPAGLALTQADWAALGVSIACFDLAALLVKPGMALLNELPSLAAYVHWPDTLILNAAGLISDAAGLYPLRSEYDGGRQRISLEEWMAIAIQLKPHALIVQPEVLTYAIAQLPDATQLWVVADEWLIHPERVVNSARINAVCVQNTLAEVASLLKFKQQYPQWRVVSAGRLNPALLEEMVAAGVQTFLSDTPADDALNGRVYTARGERLVTDNHNAMLFTGLDEACVCPTCKAGFSWAYLHHLYAHTQALCQRLLIQHNVYFILQQL